LQAIQIPLIVKQGAINLVQFQQLAAKQIFVYVPKDAEFLDVVHSV